MSRMIKSLAFRKPPTGQCDGYERRLFVAVPWNVGIVCISISHVNAVGVACRNTLVPCLFYLVAVVLVRATFTKSVPIVHACR